MVRTLYRPLLVVSLFAVAACGGGTVNSSVPGSQSVTSQSGQLATQSQARSISDKIRNDGSTENGNENVEGGDDGNGAVVYSSIPKPLKAVASVGFEATQGLELGDGVNLTHRGHLQRVRYVLSSWGCQSGHWYSNNCVTAPGATFPVPITINVYAINTTNTSRVGALLKTQTRTFNIPYRPSYDSVRCTGTGKFYSTVDASCVNGLANVVVFDFSAPRVNLPLQSIFSLVYNTTHYGPSPIGEAAPCYASSGGCGYDSLNVSTDGPGGPIGSPYDKDGIFDSFTQANDYCDPLLGTGFRLDTAPGCWTIYHPQFEVRVQAGGQGDQNDGNKKDKE
jgi:hypothetical protein